MLRMHRMYIYNLVCCHADGRMLLTACDDQHINLYDVQQGALVDSFSGESCCC
jgi:hypothetical protein